MNKMNSLNIFVITGSLEVIFEGQERLLDEVARLQKHVSENDEIHTAIDIGRIVAMAKNFSDADEAVRELQKAIFFDESAQLIDELEFTPRTYNCLGRAGITTVNELAGMSLPELKNVRNLGQKSLEEIVLKLKKLGIELGNDAE